MDRLSALPEEMIIHILSFLPIKTLLQTRTLAKSFRFHYSHASCFGFAEQTINTFSGTTNLEFESWIAAVFARKVTDLVIDLHYQIPLPLSIFTSQTLLCLRMVDCGDIPEDGFCYPNDISVAVNFPALKRLQLVNVGCRSDYSLTHLLKGCPVLEELRIEGLIRELCILISETGTITKLEIEIDIENSQTVLVEIPSLRYLRLRVRERHSFNIFVDESLALLTEADIDFMDASKYTSRHTVTDFVGQLYNIECLTLSTHQLMDVPTSYFDELGDVEFRNLTQLNLRADWRFIVCFLKNANNLRVLTIRPMVDCESTQHWMESKQVHACIQHQRWWEPKQVPEHWREPKQVPACLVSHLERVSLIDFEWSTKHEFDMLKYILKNAMVLKKIEIICSSQDQLDWNIKLEAIKKFTMFEIGSTTCELIFNFRRC